MLARTAASGSTVLGSRVPLSAAVAAIAAIVLAIASCGVLGTEPVRGVEVSVGNAAYAVGEPITVRVSNHGRRDMYFFHCDHRLSLLVEGRRGTGWEDVRSVDGPPCPAIYESGATVLRPGESYTGSFSMDRTGTFRVRLLSGPDATAVGFNIIYSAAFEVRAEG
jgi:hypothetical protein